MRRFGLAALLLVLAGALAASPASASAPPGEGLVALPGTLDCEGLGTTAFTTIPGGPPGTGPGWITESGQVTLVVEITIAAGTTTLFSKTYGNKSGREPITCTGAIGDGVTLEARLVIVN